jgi:uncharacterized protein (DUF433 family)
LAPTANVPAMAAFEVISDPSILGGHPVIRGTRISPWQVAASLESGDTVEQLCEDWPHLSETDLHAACEYAKRHPRPRTSRHRPT